MSQRRRFGQGFGIAGVTQRFKEAVRLPRDDYGDELLAEEGEDFHPDEIEEINLPTFDDEPYYKFADEAAGYENNHRLALELDHTARPTIGGLVEACTVERKEANVLFPQGMWVEYRSNDMQWKVGLVNRVVKQAPDSWDFEEDGEPTENDYNIYYNVGVEGLLGEDSLRAPAKGLQVIFGKRPWLWQQFTLLQLEKRIRFDESHEYDFGEIDCQEFGKDRFDLWLEAPQNADFKAIYDIQPLIAQNLLKDHLLTPFNLCDKIIEDKENWDFDDPDISVYTYMSVFGSGIVTVFVTFAIQIISPLIIGYNVMFLSDGDQNPRFEFEDNTDPANPTPLNDRFLPFTSFDIWCDEDNRNPRFEGKILIFIVLWVYITTVIPDSILSWYRTSGGADSTFSKINSLRQIIWYQNDDDFLQQLGYKADRIMNTGYVSSLYALMVFILVQTPIILDIILNALAIEFIHEIDERIANSDWWDEGNRWIKAGTIELIIQSTLRLRIIDSPKSLCNAFDINYEDYCEALGGSKKLFDPPLARRDDSDYRYMTQRERKYKYVANEAERIGNKFALEEYKKKPKQFGIFDVIAAKIGFRNKGVFNRYPEYRTWSRWEKILFLPKVPEEDAAESSKRMHKKMAVKVKVGQDDYTEFIYHVLLVLTGVELIRTMAYAASHGNWFQVPLKLFLGLFEIAFYLIQILFPLAILPAMVLVPICY